MARRSTDTSRRRHKPRFRTGPDATNPWARVHEDPWGRWASGQEPIRELTITYVVADDSDTLMIRMPRVDIEPGVLPDPRISLDPDRYGEDDWELRFIGRWSARWRGTTLAEASLDLFSDELDEVLRLVFEPSSPVELLLIYNASFLGLHGLTICNAGTPARNARDQPLGHSVLCRDPRLAMQIAARCQGIAPHIGDFQAELWRPTDITSDKGREALDELTAAAAAVAAEPAPGLQLAFGDHDRLRAIAALQGGDADRGVMVFNDPIATTIDTYTLIGEMGLGFIDDETRLVRVPEPVAAQLAVNLTFADAITAIRKADPDGLPLWLDFTAEDGTPVTRHHPSGIPQPLYGALVIYEDDPEHGGPFHAVVPIGRAVGLDPTPLATCVLGVGPDDAWRYPMEDNFLGIITAHRGGVVVRNTAYSYEMEGVEPTVTVEEVRREIAGHFARTSEWILARVGSILTGLDDGLLRLRSAEAGNRTFDLGMTPAPATSARRTGADIDPWHVARRLRQLGSLRRVADEINAPLPEVREALDVAGIDPDQVRRDEVLTRYRATGSVGAVAAVLPIMRVEIERFLRDAGLDPTDTPVPHDVTDPEALQAIAAYRETGTLEAAGAKLGITGESVRRRIARAGLRVEDVETDAARRQREETVAAFNEAGRSLAGAARLLGVDPRTVRDRLVRAGVDHTTVTLTTDDARAAELRALYALVGSIRRVAALTGVSADEVRRAVGPSEGSERRGRRVSDDALDQAEMAYAEHGSVRAAARALGISPGGFAYRLNQARARQQTPPDETVTEVS
jgi:molybdenum-dependent DNA-binding transcriptional regulator ModE